jgi:ABC-type transport system involved in multi-copper enzyme maturation permease subunit
VLREIVRFEWRYHTRQPAFFAAALFFLLLGFGLTATGFGPENVAVNSPYLVMQSFAFMTLFALFAVAVFASNAVLRDDEYRMRDIVFSTPVSSLVFVTGRFAGAFLATLTTVAFSAIGMIAATFMPWLDRDRVAAFGALRYLYPFAVITIPNVLFATALLFAAARLTRNAIATYTAAVAVYILYFVCAALTNSPLMAGSKPGGGGEMLPALLDPFALTAFYDVTQQWTAAVKNARFVPLVGTLLINRILWLAGAAGIWLAALRVRVAPAVASSASRTPAPIRPPRSRRILLSPSSPYLARTLMELRTFFTKSTLLLFLLWIGLAASQIYSDVLDAEYGSTLVPHTSLILAALQQPLWIITMVLIIYHSAEMFWREQHFRAASIVDTTPVSASVMIAAKWTALGALIALPILGGIATGVALQLARGFTDVQPLLYLSLFYFTGLPLLLYAGAALLIHALSPNKYAGMIFVLLFALASRRAASIGLDHELWRFASGPPVAYSEMNGFGHYARAFHEFMLYWTMWALLFVALATILWRRIGASLKERLRLLRRPGRAAAALFALVVLTGSRVYYETNIVREHGSTNATLDWKANYEKAYKRIAALPRPRITSVDTEVDLFPRQRRDRIRGRYILLNETSSPVPSIYVSVRREAHIAALAIPHARVTPDEAFGMYRFTLDKALAPGERTELRFDLTFEQPGLSGEKRDDAVVENGSLLLSFLRFPTIGYHRTYELNDPRQRQKRGLGAVNVLALDDLGGEEPAADEWIDLQATVSTDADQTAIAPGRLEGSWQRGGRRWFRYRAESPIVNRFAVASARYAVARRQHGAVTLELFYDPAHALNVAHMLDSAAAALDVMQPRFGAYPQHVLRLVEVPIYAPFAGFAMPGMILLREDRAFLTDARDPRRPDLVARRVAHEVAHQWFGGRLVAANVAGASTITESLTKYAELLVIDRMHGRDAVRQLLAIELDRYLAGRANDERSEVPLSRTTEQAYLYYSKGAIVMWAMRDLLGEAAMDRAILGLMDERHPTTDDLVRHAGGGPLVDQWMRQIVLYDLRLDSIRTQHRPDGRWDVHLRIDAAKHRGDDTALTLEEPIEIAVEGESGVLDSRKHSLKSGMNEIALIVAARPVGATVDPWITRIDRNPGDNTKAVVE